MKKIISVTILFMVLILSGCSKKTEMKKLDAKEWTTWGEFNMEGRNSTPPRVIAADEYDFIELRADYDAKEPVLFLLAAYSGKNEVIPVAKVEPVATSGKDVVVKLPIEKGYEIQVFTQVWKQDGTYDDNFPCDIKLSYRLTN